MKIKKFFINGILLTIASIITQGLAMVFRVYMSNCIGTEAIGLYQLIMTVYIFAVKACTSGMTLLVTRLVTEATALHNEKCIRSAVFRCTISCVTIAIVVGIIMFFGSSFVAEGVLHQSATELSIKALAPSLPLISISTCLRGYFYARRQAVKTAIEQLIEQLTEMGVFVLIIGALAPLGMEYACCAIAIGGTVAEAVTALYSFILYRLDIKKINAYGKKFPVKKHICFIAIPVMFSSCLRCGLNIIENATIPKGLEKYGQSSSEALSSYGLITGMVMPLLAFPSVVIMSFASIIIPEMSEVYAKTNTAQIQNIASRAIKMVLMFSVPIAVLFFFFGKEIGLLVYNSEVAGKYLSIFAVSIPIMYLDSVVDSMLKGLNQQFYHLMFNIMDSALRVIMVIVLISRFGMMGFIITTYTGAVFNTLLSLIRLIRVTEVRINLLWIAIPLVISIFGSLVLKMLIYKNY